MRSVLRVVLCVVILPILLTFISFPLLLRIGCDDTDAHGVGGLGCLVEGMGYTVIALFVFIILGAMLNSYLKKLNQIGND